MVLSGGDLGERHQDEIPVGHIRMRDGEALILEDLIIVEQNIDIESAGTPADLALSFRFILVSSSLPGFSRRCKYTIPSFPETVGTASSQV